MGANPVQCPLCSGLQALGQTFGANPAFASSLRYLDLSKNPGLLATDESNVSPRNTASSPCRSALRLQGQGLYRPFPCNSSALPSQALYSFLAQPNALVHLDLAGTDCAIDSVRGGLVMVGQPAVTGEARAGLCPATFLGYEDGQSWQDGFRFS